MTFSAPALAGQGTGGASPVATPPDRAAEPAAPVTTPLPTAKLGPDRSTAIPPAGAPDSVKNAIYAANLITGKRYRYGGGHRSFADTAYDCSGSVSYALHGGGMLSRPLDSSSFMRWGMPGKGVWITIYTNPRHAYVVIAGLRFDTAGPGRSGPRWRLGARSNRGFLARHPESL
jgi:cell wall-associated NlpC family hydrolase